MVGVPVAGASRKSKARSIVAGWAGADGAAQAESTQLADVPRSRPARLGLGASAALVKPSGADDDATHDLASTKLKQSIGKQERREQRAREDRHHGAGGIDNGAGADDADDDDDVGRSGAFQARPLPPAAGADVLAGPPKHKRPKGEKQSADIKPATEPPRVAQPSLPAQVPAGAPPPARGGGAPHGAIGEAGKGKRSKTRSKQKNMRRDTRLEHLKPTYRTPGAPDYAPPAPPAWKRAKMMAA